MDHLSLNDCPRQPVTLRMAFDLFSTVNKLLKSLT